MTSWVAVEGFWGWVKSFDPQSGILSIETKCTRDGDTLVCHQTIELEKSAEWIQFELEMDDD